MVDLEQKRWKVLLASCVINLCIGSLYAWSVFVNPLVEKLNNIHGLEISAANLAIVFTVANSVGPITMISGGYINDKFGSQKVVFAGGLLFGGGLLLSGFATNIACLILSYGLGCGLGMGMVYGITINNSVKFFPERRGMIGGITTATYGMSSVIIPPIANLLIVKFGISNTLSVLGVICAVIICGGSFFIITCPNNYVIRNDISENVGTDINSVPDRNWKEMLATKEFYLMLIILLCGAFSGLMITSQVSPMAQTITGMSVGVAASAVSVLALFNAIGRITAGSLSDKLGRTKVLKLAFAMEIVGLMCLLNSREGTMLLFLGGVSFVGICFGSLMGIYPGFTADQFGSKNNSVNYGIMFTGFAIAGILGPTMAGKIYFSYDSYEIAFYIAISLALIGVCLTIIFNRIKR